MAKATYNPSRTGTGITLSSGDRIATWASSSDKFAQLQFYRSTGTYALEFELQAGSNVALHTVGMANASANVNNYIGADAHGKGVYETSTRGTWAYDYNGTTTTIGSGPQMAVGSVMCLYVDCDNRTFFVYVHNGTTGQWIGDDPNTNPTGGFPWSFSGDGAPGYGKYHNLGGAKLRTAAEFTMTGVMPAGATQEWDDTAAAGGAMIGAASLSIGAGGTLTGAGALAGTTNLAIAPSGQLRGAGAMVGTSSLTLAASATGTLTGKLEGASTLSLNAVGTLAGAGVLVGDATLSLSASGSIVAPSSMEGDASLSIAASGTLTGTAAATGSATLSLAASGDLTAAGALEGVASMQLVAAGTLSANGVIQISGSASLGLAASGALGAVASIAGQASIAVTPSAVLTGAAQLAGNASVSITASGTGNLLGVLDGNALIAIAVVGELLGRAALVGNAGLSITARATAYTDDAGRIPYIGIRPDSFEDGPANRPHDAIEPGQRPGAIAVIAER